MSIRSNPDQPQDELFRSRLENMIDMNHPLVKLGKGIDWEVFDRDFGKHYPGMDPSQGRYDCPNNFGLRSDS